MDRKGVGEKKKEISMRFTLQRLFRYNEDPPLSWSISSQGPTIVEFLERRGNFCSNVHCKTIQRLHRSIKNKGQELLTEGVVLR